MATDGYVFWKDRVYGYWNGFCSWVRGLEYKSYKVC